MSTETFSINDPRLHPCMIGPHPLRNRPVHPTARISGILAALVAGDHDLTVFDCPHGEETRVATPQYYEHAHYVGSLALLYKATQECGWVEHTSDWDWWTGLTLRDGTRVGDGTFVHNYITNDLDEEQIQAQEEAEETHGYCDDFTVPSVASPGHFPQDADPDTNVYAGMGVRLERWTNDGKAIIETFRIADIASVHIGER